MAWIDAISGIAGAVGNVWQSENALKAVRSNNQANVYLSQSQAYNSSLKLQGYTKILIIGGLLFVVLLFLILAIRK